MAGAKLPLYAVYDCLQFFCGLRQLLILPPHDNNLTLWKRRCEGVEGHLGIFTKPLYPARHQGHAHTGLYKFDLRL